MKRRTHELVARELARMLSLDEDLVLIGDSIPDVDRNVGDHRRTLHNPYVLAATTVIHPAVFVGCGIHLILDLIPSRFEKYLDSLRRIVPVAESP